MSLSTADSVSETFDNPPEVPVSHGLLAAALDQIQDPVILTSAELEKPGPTILYVNPAFTRLTGYELDEVLGKSPRILQGERTDPLTLDLLKRRLREDGHFKGEAINYRKDGSEYVLEWEISPIRSKSGEVRYWVALQRDVTERHLVEREVLDVSTREQKRIAEDLHDNLGQTMSGMLMRMRALENRVEERQDEALTREFGDLRRHMRSALDRIRRHVRELYPVSLADDGLLPGLKELASNAEALYGVTCRVKSSGDTTIASSDVATQLYRITQEAITNSVKHGGATIIDVTISSTNGHLTLAIENNGTSISPDDLEESTGMGLRIMRQRARAIQAGFTIRPSERGTVVEVSLKNRHLLRSPNA
ncbi:hypothetical protein CRI94_07125 [Longibacter salinarum]|uniref:histidine kinase n=1 Tax=Longibacter salinarum TaxID=1850348 RepID=A0A2A8CZJ7_9BACT|nr:PAS domain S-box protein [Longibacter salinarum]PEN13828.1 hypothetical protein CRI94_07125 [Longibacter salinarum]